MPTKKKPSLAAQRAKRREESESARARMSPGQKVLIAVAVFAGLGSLVAGVVSFTTARAPETVEPVVEVKEPATLTISDSKYRKVGQENLIQGTRQAQVFTFDLTSSNGDSTISDIVIFVGGERDKAVDTNIFTNYSLVVNGSRVAEPVAVGQKADSNQSNVLVAFEGFNLTVADGETLSAAVYADIPSIEIEEEDSEEEVIPEPTVVTFGVGEIALNESGFNYSSPGIGTESKVEGRATSPPISITQAQESEEESSE